MTSRDDIRISKFLSLVLRHEPQAIGITLDEAGWVDIDTLIDRANASGRPLTRDDVQRVVATSDKQRFTLSTDGSRIRAAQGHSVDVALALPATAPPDVLYHGTAARFLPAILAEGLTPQARRHVHLSRDIETARRVGQRHGTVVVLKIDAAAMTRDGAVFYCADNGVWLTDSVPPTRLVVEVVP